MPCSWLLKRSLSPLPWLMRCLLCLSAHVLSSSSVLVTSPKTWVELKQCEPKNQRQSPTVLSPRSKFSFLQWKTSQESGCMSYLVTSPNQNLRWKKSCPENSLIYEGKQPGFPGITAAWKLLPRTLGPLAILISSGDQHLSSSWLGLKPWSSPETLEQGKGDEIPGVQVTKLTRNLKPAPVTFYQIRRISSAFSQVHWDFGVWVFLIFFFPYRSHLKGADPKLQQAWMQQSPSPSITSEPAQCNASSSSEIKTCHCIPAWQTKEECHVWNSAGWHALLWKGFWDSVPLLYSNLNRRRPTRDIPELRFVKLSLTAR